MKAKNILLIDDNDVDNYITRQMLFKNDFADSIFIKTCGADGLQFLKEAINKPELIPDYIFLDIRMPEMDGFEFLNEYSKLPETLKSNCAIFMLTSSGDQQDVDRAAQYPYVKKIFRKPLDENVLNEIYNLHLLSEKEKAI